MESVARLPLCNHLLQHTLRGVCVESEWMYSVFWRILPRNFPPPKWELGGYLDRSKANKRNWILVWEDGFCDFARSVADDAASGAGVDHEYANNKRVEQPCTSRLHPELFFKMSHEIYNYGEGLMGKIAADNGHKWIYRDPPERDNRLVSFWHNTIDPQPRIWEAQFKSGIQTIVVVAVREGLVQLGSTRQVLEDLNFVMLLQRKFNSLQQACPVQQPSLATATLQSMLSPDQVLRSMEERKVLKRLGRPDEEEPGFTRTLERRLSWSSCDSSVRPGQLFHHLDFLNTSCPDNYSFGSFNVQQNEQLIPLPLAHDVQTAADHLSLSCISATLTSTAAPAASAQRGVTTSIGYHNPCSFRINSSLLQGDLNNSSSSAESSSTASQQSIPSVAVHAGQRSVLPCISNVQALLSNQLPTVPHSASSPAALMHQHMVNDKSARLRSPSSPATTLSVPAATCLTSGSSSSQLAAAANKTADIQTSTLVSGSVSELIDQHHPSTIMPTSAAERLPRRLRQLQEFEDGPAESKKTVHTNCSSDTADARHDERMMSPLLEPVAAQLVHVELDPEAAIHDEFPQTILHQRTAKAQDHAGLLEVNCATSVLRSTTSQFK